MSGQNTWKQSVAVLQQPHQPDVDEELGVAMHIGGDVTDSVEPVRLLYTNLKDPEGLADLLLDERVDIRLVRGDFLTRLDGEKQTFIRRQELEDSSKYPDAFVTREELLKWKTVAAYRRTVRIIGVSHVWETREHPDPRGNQLAMIARAQLWHDESSWYFLDYMSVYQFYRTSVQQNRSFQYTMMHMHFFYAHEYTWTYRIEDLAPFEEADRHKHVQVFFTETGVPQDGKVEVRPLADLQENSTPYSRRGWCEAECQWSSMRSKSRQTVSLSFVSPETWTRAPMAPEVFQAKVANFELLFTHQDSAEAVKELQERVFREKAAECETLEISLLPHRELTILSSALSLYKNLTVLRISNSQVDCRGAEALSTVLTMRELRLQNLRIPGDAVRKLALGFKGNTALLNMTFTGCLVDAKGAEGLAEAIACKETKLESLDLSHNVLKCKGAKHLADALIHNSVLQRLDLSSNSIADDGAASFAGLFKNSALKLCLADNCFGKEAVAILQRARDEVLRTDGKVHLEMTHAPLVYREDVLFALFCVVYVAALACHAFLIFLAFLYYFDDVRREEKALPPAGDAELLEMWLTVPSLLLIAVGLVVVLIVPSILIAGGVILAVGNKSGSIKLEEQLKRYSSRALPGLLRIWSKIWVCYSTVWLPAMQLYTLLAAPRTEPSWTITAVIPYTLVWTALFSLLACLVLFHPMFRAIFRTFIQEGSLPSLPLRL
ncbi:NOD2 [Symbiodinium sp. CCMP2456]|nr:NOD2 [Symbiodinium sp. CCMP2456]